MIWIMLGGGLRYVHCDFIGEMLKLDCVVMPV